MNGRATLSESRAPRALLFLLLAGTTTCGEPTGPEAYAISVTPDVGLAVGIGGSVLFYATTLDRNGAPTHSGNATWSTQDPSIATISSDGRATGVSAGVTQVIASMDGFTGTASLEVYVPAAVTDYLPDSSYFGRKGYVEYIPGELPVVLAAPHGGEETPAEIPDRTYGTTVRDRNTTELTMAVRDALVSLTGHAPHVVISHLRRTKLDPNREIEEAAQGNAFAEQAWNEFQGHISRARATVESDFGGGMFFDMHGHGHPIPRVELGYLIGPEVLDRTDAQLNNLPTVQMTSIREIGRTRATQFADVLRGPMSLGGLLEAQGIPSVPSPAAPSPGSDPYFTGGYNTRVHGSLDDTEQISGIQLEHHFPGLRDTSANRRAYADALAVAIRDYMIEYFGFFEPTP